MSNRDLIFERKSYEESPSEIVAQTIGLFSAVGLLIGAILGALLANTFLELTLWSGSEIIVGALSGGAVGVLTSALISRAVTKRVGRDFD